jgi:hypothetical protein
MKKKIGKKSKKTAKKASLGNLQKLEAPLRDEKGRLLPGQRLNPSGRPKGVSITKMLLETLEQKPEGSKITYAEAILKKILTKAIAEGNTQVLLELWDKVDGRSKQTLGFEDDDLAVFLRGPDKKKEI